MVEMRKSVGHAAAPNAQKNLLKWSGFPITLQLDLDSI